MAKIPKLTIDNKLFLSENDLILDDVAEFYEMKPLTLRNSTAKNKFLNALRRYENHLRHNDKLILQYDDKEQFAKMLRLAKRRLSNKSVINLNEDLFAIDDFIALHGDKVKLKTDKETFILYFSCCT